MEFSLKRVLPRVYHLHFEDHYQLVMHFLRAQEFYESPKFADQLFTFVDYMEWYAKGHGDGAFTYPKDWSGFNVPSEVLLKVYRGRKPIPDPNKHDELMKILVDRITYEENEGEPKYGLSKNWYLIGTSSAGYKDDGSEVDVLHHELAHAMYYTDINYQNDAEVLFHDEYAPWYEEAYNILEEMGYHRKTIRDEIHAYASTGPCEKLKEVLTEEIRAPFIGNFQYHLERCRSLV